LARVIDRIEQGVTNTAATGEHTWSGNLLRVEGGNGLGPVVVLSALEKISARAREGGVALAAIRNCNHIGMLSWYAEKIARKGQVCIGLTVSEALMHPFGGREGMIGTNPICIGVPAEPTPFVLDMATSVVSMGKIHDYADRGQSLSPGWALDAAGEPTTDAAAGKEGTVAPFGGAKGYALGLAFEVLVTSLTGAAIGRDVAGTLTSDTPCNKGDVFIVAEPATGAGASISRYLEAVRRSRPVDPANPVRIPGDRALAGQAARQAGALEVSAKIWELISERAGRSA
jgi:LDH2 family malate/lactate/ureidoglycolate dehydrogenase